MRLWHVDLLPFLPDKQFRGQLREIIAILHNIQSYGSPRHLLVNRLCDYPMQDVCIYYYRYAELWQQRYQKVIAEQYQRQFSKPEDAFSARCFIGWHDRRYLRICMANLCEKHIFGSGASQITEEEWQTLCDGYASITGERYVL